jgi:DNA-binding PadR family transcriptional regulator
MSEKFVNELRERMVYQFLDVIILLILSKPDIAKYPARLKDFCETLLGVKIKPDSLYALLVMLERKGLIKGESKEILETRTIRFYQLTLDGKAIIEQFLLTHNEMMELINKMSEKSEKTSLTLKLSK